MKDDVIIIGGGAAGLFASVVLKRRAPELRVRLLEALPRVGKKLATTGNGRCNITNLSIKPENYHGKNPEFAFFALEKFGREETEKFFSKIGVPFTFEENKGYPSSLQASSVVDCLRFAAEELGVIVCTETPVNNIQQSGKFYKVISGNLNFLAENIIVATGLLSGGEKLGCDGKILDLLKKSGFKTVKTYPSIVQIKTETDIVRQLKGIKVDARVSLKKDNKTIQKEFGEVLFCDYGLSGPPILQISGRIKGEEGFLVSLDLMSGFTFDEVLEQLKKRRNDLSKRNLDEFFTGMLQKRIGQVIIKSCGLSLNMPVSILSDKDIYNITSALKGFEFKVTGTLGFAASQVTSGGLATMEFNDKTMESQSYKGFYAIGEILDIDGDCGGYNLQWAWSSAMCAADAIIKGNKNASSK